MAEEKELKLSHIEKQALIGLNVREQLIAREVIGPFQEDVKETISSIEERLGLPTGAVNTTHMIDLNTGLVIPKPERELEKDKAEDKEEV